MKISFQVPTYRIKKLSQEENMSESCLEPHDSKKIGVYSSSPLEAFGGGERFAVRLANYLWSRGVDTILVSPRDDGELKRISRDQTLENLSASYRTEQFLAGRSKILGRYVHQPLPSVESLSTNTVNALFLYRIPDIGYIHRVKEARVKLAFLLHGVTFEALPHPHPLVFAYQMYLRAQLLRVAPLLNEAEIHIQVFTERMATELVKLGVRRRLITVIPLSIEFQAYACQRNDQVFDVVFLGRLEGVHKGITRLSQVVRRLAKYRLKDLTMTIAGSGSAFSLVSQLEGSCRNVRVLGYVRETEKRNLLASAGAMLLTSNIEPYPTVLLEGLASGLPAISTPVSGPVDILSKSPRFGTATTFSAEAMVETILDFYRMWREDKEDYFEERLQRRKDAIHSFSQKDPFGPYYDLLKWNA